MPSEARLVLAMGTMLSPTVPPWHNVGSNDMLSMSSQDSHFVEYQWISMDINGISMEYQWIMDINGYHDFTQHLSTSITSTGYEQHAGRRPEAGNRGQLFRNSCGAVQEVISPHIPSYEGYYMLLPCTLVI